MAKKKTEVTIPLELARLLVAEPEDMKDPAMYEDCQALAKASLKVLLVAAKLA